MGLSYLDYCEYYAKKCPHCKGEKRILDRKVWISCSCQDIATYKWRLEQIQVSPPSLKYKEWQDFTGAVGENTITNSLTPESLIEAKSKAMEYCFGKAGISGPLNRKNNLIIAQRLAEGRNIIIAGDRSSGKSLLACLISKEAIRAKLTIKWVRFDEFCLKARWDNATNTSVNYSFFDDLSEKQVVIFDGIDYIRDDKWYGDPIVLNDFFYRRHKPGFINIMLCSRLFFNEIQTKPRFVERVCREFALLVANSKNLSIELILQNEVAHG